MFSRPVSPAFPIKAYYGERAKRYAWSIDPDNGLWIPARGPDGLGQHRGTDFDCPTGTVVRAVTDGFIIRCRYDNPLDPTVGAGLCILQLVNLTGYDSWIIKYSHLKAVYVKPGDQVCRYDPLAESGATGAVESPYLHVDLMNLKHQYKGIQFEG